MGHNIADVPFEAGGKKYIFRFGFLADKMIQKRFGMPTQKLLASKPQDEFGSDEITELFTAGLAWHHENLTERETMGILDELGGERAVTIFLQSLRRGEPESDLEVASNGAARPTRATDSI